VRGQAITVDDWARFIQLLPEAKRPKNAAEREQALAELVDLRVLAAEARRRGLEREPDVRAAIAEVLAEAATSAIRSRQVDAAEVPRSELLSYFAEHPGEFRSSERRRVEVAGFADRAAAAAALAALGPDRGEERWRKISPAGGTGDLGLAAAPGDDGGVNALVSHAVRRALFDLKEVGEVAGPIVDGETYYLVRYAGRVAPQQRRFELEEKNIRRRVADDHFAKARAAYLTEQRSRTAVTIDRDALEAIELPDLSAGYDPAQWRR
jgi:SpoVK/Ycf46/Vps4 family AAA+-type ATPase